MIADLDISTATDDVVEEDAALKTSVIGSDGGLTDDTDVEADEDALNTEVVEEIDGSTNVNSDTESMEKSKNSIESSILNFD